MDLYLTHDIIDKNGTGGGKVTYYESKFFKEYIEKNDCIDNRVVIVDGSIIGGADPFEKDRKTLEYLDFLYKDVRFHTVHCYAGCFTETLKNIKYTHLIYTVAAHDLAISKNEHIRHGVPFDYPHLNDRDLLAMYVGGIQRANLIIFPSRTSKENLDKLLHDNSISRTYHEYEIIPHGAEDINYVYEGAKSEDITYGYLGQYGLDKGWPYLLHAWNEFQKNEANKNKYLLLAGKSSHVALEMIRSLKLKNVIVRGWVKDVKDFYSDIDIYIQPSATEGFGIEVIEALQCRIPTICSKNAGVSDGFVNAEGFKKYNPFDIGALVEAMETTKPKPHNIHVGNYRWDSIKFSYERIWV